MFEKWKYEWKLIDFQRKVDELSVGKCFFTNKEKKCIYAFDTENEERCIISKWDGSFYSYRKDYDFYFTVEYYGFRLLNNNINSKTPDKLFNRFKFITEEEFRKYDEEIISLKSDLDTHTHMIYDQVPLKIESVNYIPIYFASMCELVPSHSGWHPNRIEVMVSGVDLPKMWSNGKMGKQFNLTKEDIKDITFITKEEYDRMIQEYLDKKTKKFEDVKERFLVERNGSYIDVYKANVIKKYVYGENDMFVEFEERHMSGDTNEVKLLTMEFAQFDLTYPETQNPAIKEE